jgi:hypothetical protein
MKPQEIIDVIDKINQDLNEQLEENGMIFTLSYSTNGYVDIIEFLDNVIWNSEDDCRDWIDEGYTQEDLETYIRREINKLVDFIKVIKL